MLADDGFVCCRGLFSAAQSQLFGRAIQDALGVPQLAPETGEACSFAEFPKRPPLWPLLHTEGLLDILTREMRTRPVLLPGVDTIAVNASEQQWHRDSSYDELPSAREPGSDACYRITRLITYPATAGEAPNEFLVCPGSQRGARPTDETLRRSSVRLTLAPGDAVLFDARTWHAGAAPKGVKRLIVLTFGGDDVLTAQTLQHEHRALRASGVDPTPPDDFLDLLASARLQVTM